MSMMTRRTGFLCTSRRKNEVNQRSFDSLSTTATFSPSWRPKFIHTMIGMTMTATRTRVYKIHPLWTATQGYKYLYIHTNCSPWLQDRAANMHASKELSLFNTSITTLQLLQPTLLHCRRSAHPLRDGLQDMVVNMYWKVKLLSAVPTLVDCLSYCNALDSAKSK